LTGAFVSDRRNGPQHVGETCISVASGRETLNADTPSLFEQDIGARLEAEDALEYDDDEVEQITDFPS